MLDLKQLKKERATCEPKLLAREPTLQLDALFELDERVRALKTRAEELQAKRNETSKVIGEKKRKGEECQALMQEVVKWGDEIAQSEKELAQVSEELQAKLSLIPNIPLDDVPLSPNPKDNVCVKTVGEKPNFTFPMKHHLELNEKLHLFDFPRATKTSGSNFTAYRDLGARLEWALLNYMLDIQIENGFRFFLPPHLVRGEIMYGSGQLPKFKDQLYKVEGDNLYLIPTSEVVLSGLYYDEIIKEEELPIKLCAYTPCFRREAGAAGEKERGLIRMHQFNKVEMFAFTKPEDGMKLLDEMVATAETVLQGLQLPYRVMKLVTGDLGFAAALTYDIEVWLPGQNGYKECSSISLCTDFQARRSRIRYKHKEDKPAFVYTLNGSGLATSRLMVALLECHQRADGSVALPLVLHSYMKGMKELKA